MTNYIVSGLERSGTSLMMQILNTTGFPIMYDDKRKSDKHNPNGYYELNKGFIIKNLMNAKFNPDTYKDKAIKITSYGLKFLPKGDYKILYMKRDIYEIWKSQENMRNKLLSVNISGEEMREILRKTENHILSKLDKREDISVLLVSYSNLLSNSVSCEKELRRISKFLTFDVSKGKNAIDTRLYRCRAKSTDTLSESEEEVIKERLKQLGYL